MKTKSAKPSAKSSRVLKTPRTLNGERKKAGGAKRENGIHKNNGANGLAGHGRTEHPESELTDHELYFVLQKVRNGNFNVRLPADQTGMKRSICEAMNEIIDLNERLSLELSRV